MLGRHDGRASGDLKSLDAMISLQDRLTESDSNLSDERFVADKARGLLTIVEDGKPDRVLSVTAPEICIMFNRKDKRWLSDAAKILRFVTSMETPKYFVSCAFASEESAKWGSWSAKESPPTQ